MLVEVWSSVSMSSFRLARLRKQRRNGKEDRGFVLPVFSNHTDLCSLPCPLSKVYVQLDRLADHARLAVGVHNLLQLLKPFEELRTDVECNPDFLFFFSHFLLDATGGKGDAGAAGGVGCRPAGSPAERVALGSARVTGACPRPRCLTVNRPRVLLLPWRRQGSP